MYGSWASEPRHMAAAIDFLRNQGERFPFQPTNLAPLPTRPGIRGIADNGPLVFKRKRHVP